MKNKQVKQDILNQWEPMGFPKLKDENVFQSAPSKSSY